MAVLDLKQWFRNEITPYLKTIKKNRSWLSLKANSVIKPLLVGSTSDGEVYKLNDGENDYYDQRSDDKTKQAIYKSWDGTKLTGLMARRITNIGI